MTSTEEKVCFDQMPQMVSELKQEISGLKTLINTHIDIPLPERVRRVNAHCAVLGPSNVLLVSIHVNSAASDGKWHTATGWSAYTSRGNTAADAVSGNFASADFGKIESYRNRKSESTRFRKIRVAT